MITPLMKLTAVAASTVLLCTSCSADAASPCIQRGLAASRHFVAQADRSLSIMARFKGDKAPSSDSISTFYINALTSGAVKEITSCGTVITSEDVQGRAGLVVPDCDPAWGERAYILETDILEPAGAYRPTIEAICALETSQFRVEEFGYALHGGYPQIIAPPPSPPQGK